MFVLLAHTWRNGLVLLAHTKGGWAFTACSHKPVLFAYTGENEIVLLRGNGFVQLTHIKKEWACTACTHMG